MATAHAKRLRGARIVLAALFVLVLAIVAGVLFESWRSGERARVLRHQLVAERLFDNMERELTELLAREDGRPFVDYRPNDGLIGERPQHVVGWFQVDPEGRFSVAHPVEESVRERLQGVAKPLDGWGVEPEPAADAATVTMKVPVDVPNRALTTRAASLGTGGGTSTTRNSAKSPAQAKTSNPNADNLADGFLPIDNNFNNGVVQRASRSSINTQAISRKQLADFGTSDSEGESLLEIANDDVIPPAPVLEQAAEPEPEPEPEPELEPEPEQATPATRRVWVPVEVEVPTSEEVELVDVTVGAMTRAELPTEDAILLHRTVKLDRKTWVQGVLIESASLRSELVHASLVGTGLEDAIEVRWHTQVEPDGGRLLFEHSFAAPFDDFVASALISPLPRGGAELDWALWVTSGVLLVMAAGGLLAVHRMLVLTTRQAQEREDFVSAVTHELKSPLTSIRMYSEMLEGGVVQDEAGRHGYYATIRTEAERLTRLVDDVLVFSRMERGLPIAAGSTGTVGAVIEDAIRIYRPQASAVGAEIVVELEPGAASLQVDRDALSQVLTNLLDNAVKFSTNAEDRRVHLAVRVVDGRAQLTVRDHGPGVPQALLRRMFEPFVRGERELTRTTKGTGIGLALVQRLVRHLGGEVQARNHPDGGLEVEVWVPPAVS